MTPKFFNTNEITMNKIILAFFLYFFAFLAQAKETCTPESIGLNSKSALPERLFYTGTCHYRNEEYNEAVKPWIQLAKLKKVDSNLVKLQIDTLNNLGYMMFFGYGIQKDQLKAVSYWKKSVSLGHKESEYHLCHAYADNQYQTYNSTKARPHCEKAILIYESIKSKSEDEITMISQLHKYYDSIRE